MRICPILDRECAGAECAWWIDAGGCAVLAAGIEAKMRLDRFVQNERSLLKADLDANTKTILRLLLP